LAKKQATNPHRLQDLLYSDLLDKNSRKDFSQKKSPSLSGAVWQTKVQWQREA
jgi:hypothetical protein